jgi:hypothetical protein
MKQLILFSTIAAASLLPAAGYASIPRGGHISDRDFFLFLGGVLLIMSNGILALINVLWKNRGVRIYNLAVTGIMLIGSCALLFIDLKAGGISLFIVALLGLLIFLSWPRKTAG